jgi:hypothetical protein
VLVAILSNTFATINADAAAESMFRKAVSTLEGVKGGKLNVRFLSHVGLKLRDRFGIQLPTPFQPRGRRLHVASFIRPFAPMVCVLYALCTDVLREPYWQVPQSQW